MQQDDMTKSSLSEDNFEIEEFEKNGMRLMGKSSDSLTIKDKLFPKLENLTAEERRYTLVTRDVSWDSYSRAYKKAADVLVKHIENINCPSDDLVYPIMFLYRHFLELTIKKIIVKVTVHNQELQLPEDFYNQHNLNTLWCRCEEFLLKALPDLTAKDKDDLKQINRIIKEFCELDKKSTEFRYSDNKNSEPLIKSNTQFPITVIREIIWKIYNILDEKNFYLDFSQEQELMWNEHLNN